jgi:hypothetical protein
MMKSGRVWLRLLLAIALALIALAAPIVWNGLAQGRIERQVRRAGGVAVYDCGSSEAGFRNWLSGFVGERYIGDLRAIVLHEHSEPEAAAALLQELADLQSLRTLILDWQTLSPGALEKVARLRWLTALKITDADAGDLAALRQLLSLRVLKLNNATGVTCAALEALATFPALEELDLDGSDIEGSALVAFRGFGHLKSLSLNFTQISAEDLIALAGAPQLEEVRFDPTDSEVGEIEKIQEAMPRVKIVPLGNLVAH